MKSVFESGRNKRRNVKLENCAEELLREFNGNTKIKVQHYEFNVSEFVPELNSFEDESVEVETKDIESPF
jgi:hypothetical protein